MLMQIAHGAAKEMINLADVRLINPIPYIMRQLLDTFKRVECYVHADGANRL